jgi:hypothetical protein
MLSSHLKKSPFSKYLVEGEFDHLALEEKLLLFSRISTSQKKLL